MGICKIGEKKEIDGKWFQKAIPLKDGFCHGCSFYEGKNKCPSNGAPRLLPKPIEDGGSECSDSIWVACDPPAKTKAAKPAPKAKWAPIHNVPPARAKTAWYAEQLETTTTLANKLGAENARLKNRLAKLKGQK